MFFDAMCSGVSVPQLSRHISCESVDSMNSQSSTNSMSSHQSAIYYGDKKKMKKKNWVTRCWKQLSVQIFSAIVMK